MKISDILKKEHIIKELNSCDKKNVLDELSSFLEDEGEITSKQINGISKSTFAL